MKSKKIGKYPSGIILKYIFFIITIIILVWSLSKTKNMSKIVTPAKSKVDSELLFTSNMILTQFSTNKVDVVKMPTVSNSETTEDPAQNSSVVDEEVIEEQVPIIVYDNMTEAQLTEKLNRSLPSTLSGTGYIFSSFTAQTGMDPYLSVAIVLHETGCKWGCSDLVNSCYNVGGMKGAPGCYGGEYQVYSSLYDGITSYLNRLYYNYYASGLTTPELINPTYAESSTWASQVNSYMYEVRNA